VLKKPKNLIVLFFILTAGLFMAHFALAQGSDNLLFGGLQNQTGNIIGLGEEDPRIIIAKIIRVFIGFLGIIAVGLIMYAGFLWMTSEGDSEKIERAKDILKNAVIGLLIIISSFAIATFILNRLMGGGAGGPGAGSGPPSPGAGLGALGSCSVQSVYPEPEQKDIPRNMAIIIVSFKEEVAQNTLCNDANGNEKCDASELIIPQNIRIFTGSDACEQDGNDDCVGNVTDVEVATKDNKTIVFLLKSWLGSPSEEMWYSVRLTDDIEKLNPDSLLKKGIFSSCNPDYLEWRFKVSTKIDLTPPQVESIFPTADNYEDGEDALKPAASAGGSIRVTGQLKGYAIAKVISTMKPGDGTADESDDALWDGAITSVSTSCKEDGNLTVSVEKAGGIYNALLKRDTVLLGQGVLSGNKASFSYCNLELTLKTDPNFSDCDSASCLWTINISPEVQADTLTVGGTTYVFGTGGNIEIGANAEATAANIASAISAHSSVENFPVYASGNDTVNLRARVAGEAGNNIVLKTSAVGLTLNPTSGSLTGGNDKSSIAKIFGKKDEPRNAVVQINFNETVNPLTVSGTADDVKNYIKVVNLAGVPGNYLSGKFEISNQYKTVEFISDDLCGVNACGENIYCLPADSQLAVEIKAASLDPCGSDQNCIDARKNPYVVCAGIPGNQVCKNSDGANYPLSAKPDFNGIMDTALNSLDGNKNENANGPTAQSGNPAYNENDLIANCDTADDGYKGRMCAIDNAANVCGTADICKYPGGNPVVGYDQRLEYLKTNQGDDYKWSFFVSDKIDLDPPIIKSLSPGIGSFGASFTDPVKVSFDKIMMSNSLKTGSVDIYNGKEWKNHKLINLWSLSGAPLGHWITKENLPMDGNPTYTEASIKHSMFSDSVSYRSQVGSGIKDIYQNCFKPSSDSLGCTGGPSCCGGVSKASEECPQ
jgi:hypothetical protein